MKKLGILTFQNGFNRGACDFFPLIKWQKKFLRKGLKINFFKTHEDERILESDYIGIDSRYYRELIVLQRDFSDLQFIVEAIEKFKVAGAKVILFDNDDSSGGRQWDLIKYVDLLVKKQVLKNRELYTREDGIFSYKPFVKSYGLDNSRTNVKYTPCPAGQLNKIKLGWNIGLIDFRFFPLSKYYPIGTSRLLNKHYKTPNFTEPSNERPYDSSFRGIIKKENEIYSYQRNKVIELFKNKPSMITGSIISKKNYLKEMRDSKIIVSPFGWGEVCYRDFETIINGALLIKPSMEHIDTFPNVYKENKTYIPVKWDMSNLENVMNEAKDNYEEYLPVIRNAQEVYKEVVSDPSKFLDHFLSLLNGLKLIK